MNIDKVNALFVELVEILDIERVTEYDNAVWAIYMPEDKEIEVQGLDDKEELLFSIKVSEGERVLELKKLQTLLEYNFLYRESGGLQFCMNPDNQDVYMQISVPSNSEVSRIAILITQFMQVRELWDQYLTAENQSTEQHQKLHSFISV